MSMLEVDDGGVRLTFSADELATLRQCIAETDEAIHDDVAFSARVGASRATVRALWEKVVKAQILVEPGSYFLAEPVYFYATQPIADSEIALAQSDRRGLAYPTVIDAVEDDRRGNDRVLVLEIPSSFSGQREELILLNEKLDNYFRYLYRGRYVEDFPSPPTERWRIELRAKNDLGDAAKRLVATYNLRARSTSRRLAPGRVDIRLH